MSILTDLNTPIFAAEGILAIDPNAFRLELSGLINQKLSFSLDDLKQRFPVRIVNRRLTSVSGWSVRAEWEGILWRDFISSLEIQAKAHYVLFASPAGYTTVVWLKDLEEGEALLAWGAGGQPLEAEYGGPLRMVIPQLWGYKSCKWLCRIEFLEKYRTGYWELRGYSHRALIEPGETFDINSGQQRQIPGGEVYF